MLKKKKRKNNAKQEPSNERNYGKWLKKKKSHFQDSKHAKLWTVKLYHISTRSSLCVWEQFGLCAQNLSTIQQRPLGIIIMSIDTSFSSGSSNNRNNSYSNSNSNNRRASTTSGSDVDPSLFMIRVVVGSATSAVVLIIVVIPWRIIVVYIGATQSVRSVRLFSHGSTRCVVTCSMFMVSSNRRSQETRKIDNSFDDENSLGWETVKNCKAGFKLL